MDLRLRYNCLLLVICGVVGAVGEDATGGQKLGRRRAVPVVHVQGSHYDVGFDVGRTFSSLIQEFLATYGNLRAFEAELATPGGRAAYDRTLDNMRRRYPYYVKEIQGVADGAQVPFHQLFLLQMDDLIERVNENSLPRGDRGDRGGCSSVAFHTNSTTLLGHTEDAFSETLNHFYIMSAHIIPTPEDKEAGAVEERFSSLCYAGHMPGYTMGFNDRGLVFSINTLSPQNLRTGNTPRTFITRALLAARSLDDAERIMRNEGLGAGNGFSMNMVWSRALPGGGLQTDIYNVEVAPDPAGDRSLVDVHLYSAEPLVHCNLYQRLKVTEVVGAIIDSSAARLQAIRAHPPPRSRTDLQDLLSDTSGKDFQVFQEKNNTVINTIAAGVFDIQKRTWSIYIDRPNASEPVAVLPISFAALDKARS